jgi:hypothetical protein
MCKQQYDKTGQNKGTEQTIKQTTLEHFRLLISAYGQTAFAVENIYI